jgi:hypothetical protein
MEPHAERDRWTGWTGVLLAAFIAAMLFGLRLGAVSGAEPGPPVQPAVELAFLAIYGSPALLGGAGLVRADPGSLLAGGLVALPLACTSFALVTLPMVVPALLLFVAARDLRPARWMGLQIPMLVAATVAAWFALFSSSTVVAYRFPGGSGSAQEPTVSGAALALALVALAVGLAFVWPRRRPEAAA